MIRKTWNTNLRILLVLMLAATFATTTWADGKHGTKFTVKNESGGKIFVHTYSGDDSWCFSPHKDYKIGNGGKRTAKCHGHGTHRCKFTVWWVKYSETLKSITRSKTCKTRDGPNVDMVKNGETCTITGRHTGDYNCHG